MSMPHPPRYELQDPAAGRYRQVVHLSVRSWHGSRHYCELHPTGLPRYETMVLDSASGRRLPAHVVDAKGAARCGASHPALANARWLRVDLPRAVSRDEWYPLIFDTAVEDSTVLRLRADTLEFRPVASMSGGDYVVLPAGWSLLPGHSQTRVDTLPDGRVAVRLTQITAVASRLAVKAVRP